MRPLLLDLDLEYNRYSKLQNFSRFSKRRQTKTMTLRIRIRWCLTTKNAEQQLRQFGRFV